MNDTAVAFEELESILVKECEMHELLLDAATGVNVAIKKNDLNTIQKHTGFLDDQVFQIEQIEARRIECCGKLSSAIGIPGKKVRLGAIIEKAPPLFREKLKALQAALKNALAKIAKIMVSNRILIEEGLRMVQGQFAIIMQSASGSQYQQYQRKGGRSAPKHSSNRLFNQTI